MDLVTVESFDTVEEAHLARNRLAAEGIKAFVEDGATAGLLGPHNPAFLARLQVPTDQADRARKILREVGRDLAD